MKKPSPRTYTSNADVIVSGMAQEGIGQSAEAGEKKPTGKAAQELTPAILAKMSPGMEMADLENPDLRVRCGATGKKVFFCRYKAASGALRQIKLGEYPPSGSMTPAAARKAFGCEENGSRERCRSAGRQASRKSRGEGRSTPSTRC